MRSVIYTLVFLLFHNVAQAADPAAVLGHAFGSLGCVEVEDPDGRTTCEARALSSGKGCYGLSSQTMRDKCLNENLYPTSSMKLSRKVKKSAPVNPPSLTTKTYMEPLPPVLSEGEMKRLEESFGLKNVQK